MTDTPPPAPPDKLARLLKRWVHDLIFRRRWRTFVAMGICFFVFGVGTLNLFHLLNASGAFLLANGLDAIREGGLRQLLEILVTGYASLVAYVLFKACEYRLAYWLNGE